MPATLSRSISRALTMLCIQSRLLLAGLGRVLLPQHHHADSLRSGKTQVKDPVLIPASHPLLLPNTPSTSLQTPVCPQKSTWDRSRGICTARETVTVRCNTATLFPHPIPQSPTAEPLLVGPAKVAQRGAAGGKEQWGKESGEECVGTFEMKWTECQDLGNVRDLRSHPVHTLALA